MLLTYDYPQFDNLCVVHVALFTDVSNADTLRDRIIKAATITGADGDVERESVNFAFIDARLITSTLHLKTAIYQALLAESQSTLRTKSVHSEILWALNPTNNITEAIRRYGVSSTSTSLFVVRCAPQSIENIEDAMLSVVKGNLSPVAHLKKLTDWATVKKYHKLNADPAIKDCAGDIARENTITDNITISLVAMKSVVG